MKSARSLSNASRLIGRLFPHAISRSLDGSRTKNLSLGERPVWGAVLQTSGPPAAIIPSPLRTASSYRAETVRLDLRRAPAMAAGAVDEGERSRSAPAGIQCP